MGQRVSRSQAQFSQQDKGSSQKRSPEEDPLPVERENSTGKTPQPAVELRRDLINVSSARNKETTEEDRASPSVEKSPRLRDSADSHGISSSAEDSDHGKSSQRTDAGDSLLTGTDIEKSSSGDPESGRVRTIAVAPCSTKCIPRMRVEEEVLGPVRHGRLGLEALDVRQQLRQEGLLHGASPCPSLYAVRELRLSGIARVNPVPQPQNVRRNEMLEPMTMGFLPPLPRRLDSRLPPVPAVPITTLPVSPRPLSALPANAMGGPALPLATPPLRTLPISARPDSSRCLKSAPRLCRRLDYAQRMNRSYQEISASQPEKRVEPEEKKRKEENPLTEKKENVVYQLEVPDNIEDLVRPPGMASSAEDTQASSGSASSGAAPRRLTVFRDREQGELCVEDLDDTPGRGNAAADGRSKAWFSSISSLSSVTDPEFLPGYNSVNPLPLWKGDLLARRTDFLHRQNCCSATEGEDLVKVNAFGVGVGATSSSQLSAEAGDGLSEDSAHRLPPRVAGGEKASTQIWGGEISPEAGDAVTCAGPDSEKCSNDKLDESGDDVVKPLSP